MTRPVTISSLEIVYSKMTQKWLQNTSEWKYDSELMLNDTRTCLAIYTLDHWKLVPSTWNRLQEWLKPLLDVGMTYNPTPSENEGLLHFTFHQCSQFKIHHNYSNNWSALIDDFKQFLSPLAGLEIEFRGLCVTPTGIGLRGFPVDNIQCRRLMETRNKLESFFHSHNIIFEAPYINDICHATLFRWTKPPTKAQLEYIQITLHTWNEAVFATYCASSWYLGFGTYKMTLPQRQDLIKLHTPLFVAHRGLTNGPSKEHENNIHTLRQCVQNGHHAECDIWYVNYQLFLGHDSPTVPISFADICSPYLWLHAKNKDALDYLLHKRNKEGYAIRIFWHTDEDYIFTTELDCIVFPGKDLLQDSVFMMPESTTFLDRAKFAHTVCSDYSRF
jgi:hypothetical protein